MLWLLAESDGANSPRVLTAVRRCFFRGGDRTPPSSLSDDEARLAALHSDDIHQLTALQLFH